jgi:nucleoside-diphosphate-sugar epimerase
MPVPSLHGVPVLVTGGAGFIGSHLVDALLAAGAAVRVLDNFATGREENLREEAALVRGDLRDPEACREACRDVRFVFHQAALGSVPRSVADPATTIAVNVTGTANLFAAAREAGVQRLVYASSSSVYGDSERLPKREGEEGQPLSPYAFSKRAGEDLARVWTRTYSQELLGLRYFNVYGPRQDPDGPYAAVIPRFFRAASRGEPLVIFGDGEQSRDFTFVSDAVHANLLAAGAPSEACGRACNVASGRRTTLNELATRIRELAGIAERSPIQHAPPRPGDVRHSLADLQEAGRQLGYAAAVSLENGLRRLAPP